MVPTWLRALYLPMLAAALAACDEPAPSAPAPSPTPATEAPTAPSEPPRDARLAVLRKDDLVVLDADALEAPPVMRVPSAGAAVLLDVTAAGRFLLTDGMDAAHPRIVLADADGARVLATDRRQAFFDAAGRVVSSGLRPPDFSCGSMSRDPFVAIHDPSAPPEARPREHPGQLLGVGADGRSLVLRQVIPGRCGPGGGRAFGSMSTFEIDQAGAPPARMVPADAPITLGLTAEGRVVASLEVTGFGFLGSSECTLVVGGARHALTGSPCDREAVFVSSDGRWVAASVVPEGQHPALRVFRATDGAIVGQHDGGEPLGTIRLGPPRVAACFSPDGSQLVVARADMRVVRTTPEGGAERALGEGGCVGFSPDGRYLLLVGTGGRVTFRVVAMDDGATREITDAFGARFLPARAR